MKWYLKELNPKHCPPHRIEQICITEVIADGAHLEFSKILEDHRSDLIEGFVSANTDFWTDSHHKEQFGALIVDVTAFQYVLEDGQAVCRSHSTRERIDDGSLLSRVCHMIDHF